VTAVCAKFRRPSSVDNTLPMLFEYVEPPILSRVFSFLFLFFRRNSCFKQPFRSVVGSVHESDAKCLSVSASGSERETLPSSELMFANA
jgi:hypothetical protein